MGRLTLVMLAAAVVVGCEGPESRCRTQVTTMKSELVGVVGSSDHRSADDPYVKAHTRLDVAQGQLATGNYEGCLESIEAARNLLERAD